MMKRRYVKVLILFVIGTGICQSQSRYDHNYVMGYWSYEGYKDPILQFTEDAVVLKHERLANATIITGTTMSNKEGKLIFYSNGCNIATSDHEIMENGSGLNPGRVSDDNCFDSGLGYTSGQQSMLSLPLPTSETKYIMFHDRVNIYSTPDSFGIYHDLNYTIIDMSYNDGKGKVIQKNIQILSDTIVGSGNITAVKHSNGVDWWVIKQDFQFTNKYYKILVTADNVLLNEEQNIGKTWFDDGGSQASFSADGTKYFRFSRFDGLYIMDFDRATGVFSNFKGLATSVEGLFVGACFSPNGRFIYLGNGPSLYQVDLEEDTLSADLVAEWDGFIGNNLGQPTYFGMMQTGPDCRIYMHTGYCLEYMHIIMKPDEKGIACDVRQRALKFDTPVCNIPHFPNYRLDTPYDYCNPDVVVLTGTNDIITSSDRNAKMIITPNPSSGNFLITAPDKIDNILVTDINGRTVNTINNISDMTYSFDGQSLSPGIYIIKVTGLNDQVEWVSKIVKID
ncbi:MAG TPA: T9SS type A sorting domain-containing protein [Saprospiraceae bacterium]|nr:T9SS type A sorting domain-containing protein [Saprospiraceae bacterium]